MTNYQLAALAVVALFSSAAMASEISNREAKEIVSKIVAKDGPSDERVGLVERRGSYIVVETIIGNNNVNRVFKVDPTTGHVRGPNTDSNPAERAVGSNN